MLQRKPGGYSAAVLTCTSPAFGSADGDFQRKFVEDRIAPLDAGKTMADLAPGIVDQMMGPAPRAPAREMALEIMSAVPADTYRAAVRCLVTFDGRANLPKIAVPTLCVAGGKDPNAPAAMVERMASKMPGSRYVCLPDAGHLPNLEAPAAFDAAVLGFLREVLSGRGS
jgi:pimeloyl-ACP methyl ester carboxylesterase